jgi:hypothetical protein
MKMAVAVVATDGPESLGGYSAPQAPMTVAHRGLPVHGVAKASRTSHDQSPLWCHDLALWLFGRVSAKRHPLVLGDPRTTKLATSSGSWTSFGPRRCPVLAPAVFSGTISDNKGPIWLAQVTHPEVVVRAHPIPSGSPLGGLELPASVTGFRSGQGTRELRSSFSHPVWSSNRHDAGPFSEVSP